MDKLGDFSNVKQIKEKNDCLQKMSGNWALTPSRYRDREQPDEARRFLKFNNEVKLAHSAPIMCF